MVKLFESFIIESNRSKIFDFKNPSISKKFTCSIEIEMETKDTKGADEDYTEDEIQNIVSLIRNSTIKELYRIEKFKINDDVESFLENILYEIENDYDDYDYIIDEILDESLYKNGDIKKKIIGIIKSSVLNYFFVDNISYLKSKVESKLPNFWKKWQSKMKMELDNTLKRGIEISNKTYLEDTNDLIELIEDFYLDFNSQKYWIFNSRTGIHINIGPKSDDEFNPIKGLLFLNDIGDSPFVFLNMEWRKKSKFCNSLLRNLSSDKKKISSLFSLLKNGEMNKCESIINNHLITILHKDGYKNFGVNLLPIKSNKYVEFRYPGGKIKKNDLIEKLLYFTYIVHLMTNKEYDKKEYHKKLFKFLSP